MDDADAEVAETRARLDAALDHTDLAPSPYDDLDATYDELSGRLIK